jgi:type I restriction enzyme S subunit
MSASKWKPYPSYKDSDTFAKRIPIHWNELALKRVSSINDDTLPEDTNPMREMCYVDIGSVSYEDGITECEEMVFEKSPSRARRLANDGDVIVSTVRTYLKAICKIEKTTDEMVFSTGFAVVRPDNSWKKNSIGDFIVADYFVENVVANSDGVSYPAINASDLGCLKIIQPPLNEQEKIKHFLKTKISKMNSSISSLNTQIKRLEEKRSTLITRAVTKGFDSNVSMKNSEIEWIGKIPEHWEIIPLKRDFEVQLGKMLQNEPKSDTDTHEYYLKSANIQWDGVSLTPQVKMWFSESEKEKYLLKKGDLLVSEGGDVGRSCLYNDEYERCYIQNAINRVRPTGKVTTEYLYYFMKAMHHSGFVEIICNKSTIPHFTAEKVAEVRY